MAVSAGGAELKVVPILAKDFSRSLATQMAGPATRSATKTGKDSGRKFGASFSGGIRTGVGPVRGILRGFGPALAGAFGATALVAGIKSVTDEAREAAVVGRITTARLKSTGGAANVTAKQVEALAERLSNLVGVDDDLIQAGENLLLTFKGVRNEAGRGNDVFTQATKLALDLAAGMNNGKISAEGLKTANIQLGKALEDPVRGITALRRSGVSFTKQQQEQIKTLVKSGDTLKAQKIILKAVAEQFGGTAAASADAGKRFGTFVGNLKERIGGVLLPVLDSVATTMLNKVIPAIGKWVGQFRKDLLPHLDRMKAAWDANKGAIAGFVTGLGGSKGQMASTSSTAKTLADSIVAIANAGGDASRFLTNLGNGLDSFQAGSERFGASVRQNVTGPIDNFLFKAAKWIGINKAVSFVLDDVKADLADVGIRMGTAAQATDKLSTAGDRHISVLRAEKQAVDALKNALRGEENAELDVRQAKLNLATAQGRLTTLTKNGRRGSLEYRQAQIDLRRAQIDLKSKTDAYKVAQQKAASATGGAAQAAQRAQGPYQKFGATAKTAGGRAYQMGKSARDGLSLIQSRRVSITATFGFKAGKTLGKTSIHDIVGATGGLVTPTAIVPRHLHRGGFLNGPGTDTSDSIPARLSKGEYVVRAKAVRAVGRDTLDNINAQGFAAGGPVLDANFPSGSRVGRVARRFEGVIDKAIARLGTKMDRYADKLAAGFIGGTGKAAITRFIRSTDPLPYIWGGAGPGGYDCSGLVGAVALAHRGKAYGHGQRVWTTSSIRSGMLGIKPGLGGVLQIGVTSGTGHMAGRYGGLGFEAEGSRTGIKIGAAASRPESFARTFHMASGGLVEQRAVATLAQLGLDVGGDPGRLRVNGQTFDRGGTLSPGLNLLANRTGRPEPLVPAGGSGRVEVTVNLNGVILSDSRAARDLADRLEPHIRNAVLRSERRR